MAIMPVFSNSAFIAGRKHLMDTGSGWRKVDVPIRFGFFMHPERGPVLIDTGYTIHTTQAPDRSLALRIYNKALRPRLIERDGPVAFLARQGVKPEQVRTIIVTHLHADHVSGLKEFPNAEFLASSQSLELLEQKPLWRHGVFADLLPKDFKERAKRIEDLPLVALPQPLPPGRDLFGDGLVQALDLPGHMAGHFGLHFAGHAPGFVYACDAQWLQSALKSGDGPAFPLSFILHDRAAARASSDLLRHYAAQGGDVLLCHQTEPHRFDALTS